MADKTYRLKFDMSDGTQLDAGTITAPQGPEGPQGPQGEAPTEGPLDPNAKTGNPVTLQDQWQGYPFGVKVNVEPVQSGSGDPSPSNVRPIAVPETLEISSSGKNLIAPDKRADGNRIYFGGVTLLAAGVTYTVSVSTNIALSNIYVRKNDQSETVVAEKFETNQFTFSVQESGEYVFNVWASQYSSVNDLNWAMLEIGNVANTYEPYKGDTYTVNLPADFGGGTVDMTGGTAKKTRRKVTITGDEPCVSYSFSGLNGYAVSALSETVSEMRNGVCSIGRVVTNDLNPAENDVWIGVGSRYVYFIGIANTFSTKEEFTSYLSSNPVTIVYDLVTPEDIEIPAAHIPALPGTNVLTTNGTSLEVSQRQGQPDLNAALLRRIAALEATATGI